MKRELNKFLFKLLLLGLVVALGYAALYRFRIYPVLTVSQLFDSKVLDARRQLSGPVRLIVTGSSEGLYDLDSKMIADSLDRSFYNFASWGMQMSDIGAALRAFVQQYRPSYLVICTCDRDFMYAPTPSYADYARTPAWVREAAPQYFYIRNYSPIRVLWRRRFKSRRPRLDAWGGASVEEMWQGLVKNEGDDRLQFPTAFSDLQYRSLDSLCRYLKVQKVTFAFVQVPTEARFAGESGGPKSQDAHANRCRSIVTSAGGIYLNYFEPAIFPDSLFADHTHLTRAGATVLTRKMIGDLKAIIK